MSTFKSVLLRTACTALLLGAPLGAMVLVTTPDVVEAKTPKKPASQALPKPYVSRALKAVLMPVTKAVAKKFKLAKGAKGVMIVSVKPGGLAKQAGLKPGDVISDILGRPVRKPSDVDTIIAYFLKNGVNDYPVTGVRKNGRTYRAVTPITEVLFYEPIDVYALGGWVSFYYDYPGFYYDYSDYVNTYSETIYTSYEHSETYISETIVNNTFVSEMNTTVDETTNVSYDETIENGTYVTGGEGVADKGNEPVTFTAADDPPEVADDTSDADLPDAVEEDPSLDPTPAVDPAADETGADAAGAESGTAEPSAEGDAPAEDTATEDPAAADEPAAGDAPVEGDPATAEDAPAEEDPAATEDAPPEEDPGTAEDAPAEDPSAEDAPADEPAAEDPSVEDAPVDDAPVDDTPVEEATPEEAPMDDTPVEEAAPEEAPMEEAAPAEEPPPEEPVCNGQIIDGVCTE